MKNAEDSVIRCKAALDFKRGITTNPYKSNDKNHQLWKDGWLRAYQLNQDSVRLFNTIK